MLPLLLAQTAAPVASSAAAAVATFKPLPWVIAIVTLLVLGVVGSRFKHSVLLLDRRIIYVVVFVLVLTPLIWPLKLPITQTPEVQKAFQMVENLKAGDGILISVDFGPSTSPECLPVYEALLHQCF